MAKVKSNFLFSNNLGEYSVYKMKGVEKLCIRSKGGPSKEKIKTAPEFEEVRENNTEYGGCSKCTSIMHQALIPIKQLSDYNFFNGLITITKFIQNLDGVNPHGQQSIEMSANRSLLVGFNLNKRHLFDTVIKANPSYTIDRSGVSASITIPKLYPGMNFINPWNFQVFRLVATLGIFPDLKYTSDGYKTMNDQKTFRPVKAQTDWMATETEQPATQMILSLNKEIIPDSSDTLMLSIGIEMGRILRSSIIQPAARVGGAKILGVG